MEASFLKLLRAALPADSVLTSEEDCVAYASDWTKVPGKAGVVVLPRNTEEVSRVLALCSQNRVAVVPSGGRTGLAGGAVAAHGELVLSLARLSKMEKVSHLSRTVRVGAGAVTEAVHQHCEAEGLTWPIDLASKGSCQIGGNLSTNAGGLRVIRYGMARKWVTSLEVVTVSGQVLELNTELEKNNTGYDLLQLIVGSEGTLAVITQATLKLVPVSPEAGRTVLLFSVEGLAALPVLFEWCRKGPFEILAFEFFSNRCLKAVGEKLGRRSKLGKVGSYYALVEISGNEPRDEWMQQVLSSPLIVDAMLAESTADRKAAWGLREGITESLALYGALRKHDLCVPIRNAAGFLGEVEAALEKARLPIELFLFGHFGDGSPHVNLVCPPGKSPAEFNAACDRFEPTLFELLKKHHGSISSEHGIGLLKKKWLSYSRTPEEVKIFKTVKAAFDPQNLLNPGKIFD